MAKITAPEKGFKGIVTGVQFVDGVGETDNDSALAYFRRKGYGIGSKAPKPAGALPEPADPRKVGESRVGTPIRDGAVDPEPGDFLGPTNAGEVNPHGPESVNPEIHASEGVRPVKGGEVHVDDPDAQDEAEKAHAEAATDGTPVTLTEAEKADQPDPEPESESDTELKGQALDAALEERGLPKSGTADEKRNRVAEHDAGSKGQG